MWIYCSAMMIVVALSNYLVQFPINDWLTLGAFSYPFSFLVTEWTNYRLGPRKACQIVLVGFVLGLYLSFGVAPFKIACASALAFLISQLLDIAIFSHLRRAPWWAAPLCASMIASLIDTFLFFGIAFSGENVPLLQWILGDFGVKVAVDLTLLIPFRYGQNRYTLQEHLSQPA